MVWRIFCFVLAISIGLLLFGIYTIYSARSALNNVPEAFAFGPEDADISMIGFLDYSCTHCRDSYAPVMEAIKKDGKVKFTPLLVSPPESTDEYAMRLTYGAGLQDKYKEAFQEIMGNYRAIGKSDVTDFALKLGLDSEKLEKSVNDPIVDRLVLKSQAVFRNMNGQYTPTFFIGSNIKYVPTVTPTAEDFLRIFKEARGQ